MQNDESFSQSDFAGSMTNFDLFGYPLSAPANGTSFENGQNFWDPDAMGMGTMDIDFNVSADLFATTSPNHRQLGSFDWGQPPQTADHMFQQPSGAAPTPAATQPQPEGSTAQAASAKTPTSATSVSKAGASANKTVRPLAPKPASLVTSPDTVSFPTSQARGEDALGAPLFSRPPSSGTTPSAFNSSGAQRSRTQPMGPPGPSYATHQPIAPRGGPLRRSVSTREMGTTKQYSHPSLGSPVKPTLQRSFSDNKGKKPTHRASLPTLAPAIKPPAHVAPPQVSNPGPQGNRSRPTPGRSASGRVSPTKHHHRRLPSLSAIPESSPRLSRTDVKFVIDSKGRARVEPIIVNGEYARQDHPPSHSQKRNSRLEWDSSGNESSDSDDDPIVIPSRNTSFALPDPIEVKPSASFHASQRSLSERSARSFSSYSTERRGSMHAGDIDTETIKNEPREKPSGDAVSELRKVKEIRQKRPVHPASGHPRFARPVSFGGSLISPTSLTDSSNAPTPSTESHEEIRCVCNSTVEKDCEYMVQCESCLMWLHGRCLNINRSNHPRVYICAFCANTPNMRNGRMRVASSQMGPPATIPSPLAHKSFKSFR